MKWKALTISQPFASLIANGEKRFENRTWECLYRGQLAIHAGKGTQYLNRKELAGYTTSAIVAVCRVIACIHVPSARDCLAHGKGHGHYCVEDLVDFASDPHFEGPFAIVLDDIAKLNMPIVISGKQGLWDVPSEHINTLESAMPVPF